MLDVIRHLGAVQIDSISVVARSHHIVLWSRLGNHEPEWLNELLAVDRAIFEYWTHAAAYSPLELYPYFRRAMIDRRRGPTTDSPYAPENHESLLDDVLTHIHENGTVSTKSFGPPEGADPAAPWSWYGNKPTNWALDVLWSNGTLMIDRREKFMRYYDLTHRIIPDWNDSDIPSVEEEQETLAATALTAMGLTTPRWLPDYFRMRWGRRKNGVSLAEAILHRLVERGIAIPATVEQIDEPVYVSAAALAKRFKPSRTTLLSPFDSLIWDRNRTKVMFDFELRLEAYTPKAKRRYGYFCLPILYRDRLVGRLDPKVHRKTGVLTINAIHLEPWFAGDYNDEFVDGLAMALDDFRRFNEADTVEVGWSDPDALAEDLTARLSTVLQSHERTADN